MKNLIFLALLLILSNVAIAEQTSTADLNGDGSIDLGDLSVLASRWMAVCSCAGKQCGDDGCGGSCGTCPANSTCDGSGGCVLICDNVGFEMEVDSATDYTGDIIYNATSVPATTYEVLAFEIYASLGGPSGSGSYPIPPDNYADTNLAVVVYSECDSAYQNCQKIFYANSGTMSITSIGTAGDQFTGSLSNVELIEVTIDPSTFVSTPVSGGEDWCISDYDFDTVIN